jgi:hypothetical protein
MNFNDTFVFHVSHEEFLDGFIRRTHDDLYFMPSADESGYLASTSAIIKFALDSLNDARLYSALTAHFNAGLTLFRILTCVAWLTGTVVIVDQIDASGAVLALSHAVVDVGVAVFSHPSDPAFATVVADQVGAGDGVDAGGGQALVRVWNKTRLLSDSSRDTKRSGHLSVPGKLPKKIMIQSALEVCNLREQIFFKNKSYRVILKVVQKF